MKTWSSFEEYVRDRASLIFGGSCRPGRVGGVDIDGVIDADDNMKVLIEITVRKDLQKAREDIGKLVTARNDLVTKNIIPRMFCVIEGSVTKAMLDAAAPHYIKVLSAENFSKIFFDFRQYDAARSGKSFGSAVDPITGIKDETDYIPVTYIDASTSAEVGIANLASMILAGKNVVLLGEYGTGKSRCLREIYKFIAAKAAATRTYPIALDLRDAWGLVRGQEIIRRHVDDLGIDSKFQSSFIRALNSSSLIVLLDGFDEIGSQSWSNDNDKLRGIRAKSLLGVKDLIRKTGAGIFISGREHYFNNNEEMYLALGLIAADVTVIRCKNEFTEEETEAFFARSGTSISIPDWLPRRPLVCQTIANLSADEMDEMFGVGQNELRFFDHFMEILCKRDARINAAFDPSTIERVLLHLAQITRSKTANVGPVTLLEVQNAFESVVGQMPVDESANMLQRLPALGRVKAESNDRQFIDEYILDGLRAKNIIASVKEGYQSGSRLLAQKVINPLGDLGQRILGEQINENSRSYLQLANNAVSSENYVLAADVVASSLRGSGEKGYFDFGNISIKGGTFKRFDMSKTLPKNLFVSESVFGEVVLPKSHPDNVAIDNCLAEQVIGVASVSGLPAWITKLSADRYDSVENVSRIRQIGLTSAHELLVTIVRKTFFQKGAGRKEEALLRGLGQQSVKNQGEKILNNLLKKGILSRFKGDEGWVYSPVRSHAGRMKKMLYELNVSQDELWHETRAL